MREVMWSGVGEWSGLGVGGVGEWSGLRVGGAVRGEMFNGRVMGYGSVMVSSFIMLVVIGAFGNYLMVMEVVEGDMVWSRLNGMSVGVSVGGLVMFVVVCRLVVLVFPVEVGLCMRRCWVVSVES